LGFRVVGVGGRGGETGLVEVQCGRKNVKKEVRVEDAREVVKELLEGL
jgi:hypothetical protein